MHTEIVKYFTFEAAHLLPHVPAGHKCRRLHGHSYRVGIHVAGQVDPDVGWLIDYGEIAGIVQPLITDHLDHYYLNEVEGLDNPTSEQIARWLWERIRPRLPGLVEIEVLETCTSACRYRGD